MKRVAGISVLYLAIILVVGCGGKGAVSGPPELVPIQPPSPAADATGLMSPGDALAEIPNRESSSMVLHLNGNRYVPGLAQRVENDGSSTRLIPASTGESSGISQLAFAIYNFNVAGYVGAEGLTFEWDEAPADYSNLWVGLGNWERNSWDWFPGPPDGVLDLGETGFADYTKPSGAMLVTLALHGSSPARFKRLGVGGHIPQVVWPMFGHDAQHTRRSPYVGAQTNNLKWTAPLEGYACTPPVIGSDGTIYVGSAPFYPYSPRDGILIAFNPDGTRKWEYEAGGWPHASPAIGLDGTIYIGCDEPNVYTRPQEGKLHAVNPDGTGKWVFEAGECHMNSDPTIGPNGEIFFNVRIGEFDPDERHSMLYAINPDSSVKWALSRDNFPDDNQSTTSSVAIAKDGTVYAVNFSGKTYAFNPDGSVKWNYVTGMVLDTPAIDSGGRVYVGNRHGLVGTNTAGVLFSFNADGSLNWTFHDEGYIEGSPTISPDGTVILAFGHNYDEASGLYAINPDGTEMWTFSEVDFHGSYISPAIGADGTVYLANNHSVNQGFLALHPDGTIKWTSQLSGTKESPAIGANGTVYVATMNYLYAFGGGSSPIAVLDAEPTVGLAPLDVFLDASDSLNGDGTIMQYEWDFDGDGVYDSSGASSTANHTYAESGIFSAAVRVTDNGGASGIANAEITVVESGEWGSQTIDGTKNVGQYSSMAIVDGFPAVSYYAFGSDDLKFVRASDSHGNNWDTPITVDTNLVGAYSSLAIVNGFPAISYFDSHNEDLLYVRATDAQGSAWDEPVTLDSTGDVGSHTSLAIVAGFPAVSYYDDTNNHLKYVLATDAGGSAWGTPLVIDIGNVGEYTFLAVVDGNPAISYHDGTNGSLKYVRATDASGSTWGTPLTIDNSAAWIGYCTSLAIVNGNPAISYIDGVPYLLKYVRATDASGSSWGTPQTPGSASSIGGHTSLAVVDGNPAISYFDGTGEDLMYVRATDASGASWDTPQALDTAGNVGSFSSLTVVDGSPAISYRDNTNDDLKYVRYY